MKLLTGNDWAPYLKQALLDCRESVRLSVFVFSHRWRSVPKSGINLLEQFEKAALRGIDCRAVLAQVDTRLTADTPNVGAAEALTAAGWKVRLYRGARMLHEKVILIDRRLVIIGSHNISQSSSVRNLETSLAVESDHLAAEVRTLWWNRWNQSVDSRIAIPEMLKHGTRKAARTTAITGRDVLEAAGIR